MYYYAVLNENNFVVDLVTSETDIADSTHISITEEQYSSGNLLWLYYKNGQFIVCDNFIGSCDWISYKNTDRPITPKFDEIDSKLNAINDTFEVVEDTLANLESGKANINHTHTEYAIVEHEHALNDITETDSQKIMSAAERTKLSGIAENANNYVHPTTHPASMITGLSDVAISGSYDDLSDKPTSMNPTAHTHTQSEITGLDTALSGKSNTNHSHTVASTSVAGFMSAADKSKLNGIAANANAYTHPATHPASMITGLPTTLPANGGNADTVDGKHAVDFATASHNHDSNYADINHNHNSAYAGINHNHNTVYADISHTHGQSEITGLDTALAGKAEITHNHNSVYAGINHNHDDLYATVGHNHDNDYSAISHTHANATTTAAGFMSKDDKSKLDGIATGANKTVVDSSLSSTSTNPVQNKVINTALAEKAESSHTHNVSDISGTLPIAKGGTGATTAASALTNLGITATAAELNKMDGVTATTAELNYVDGVTSNIQTQLNGKADSSHNHNSAYIAKSLQMTADDGDVAVSWTNQDVVAKIKALPTGMYTAYAKSGTTNNPKSVEAWRFMVHKTGATYGWVMAFGSFGSVYTGYVDNGTWRGWKCIWDNTPTPLWTGAMYMSSSNSTPQTVTPSKKLSECRNGWLLLWSDYDPGRGANDADFVTTMIPKKNPSGGTWGGKSFLCDIPRYVGSDPDDTSTEKRIIKPIYVHDDCIKGSYQNASGDRNDVVLRAVYEW